MGLTGKSKNWQDYARKNDVVSGYFNNKEDFVHAAKALDDRKAKGVYFTINPANPSLLARAKNRLIASPKANTTDTDREKPLDTVALNIKCLRWLLIDLDPIRPSDISATDEEQKKAEILGRKITTWLEEGDLGFPKGIRGMSGNSYHIMYRLPDLPNDEEHWRLRSQAIKAIAHLFKNDEVDIDQKVKNPARLWKLYGITGRKGDSTEERPHRTSYLFADQPTKFADVPIVYLEQLKELAVLAPTDEAHATPLSPLVIQGRPAKQSECQAAIVVIPFFLSVFVKWINDFPLEHFTVNFLHFLLHSRSTQYFF